VKYRDLVLADAVLRKHVYVPRVYEDLSSSRVLTSELVPGLSIDKAMALPQGVRNAIARTMLIMTIRELFEWRFIQSDPNFGNFLYDDPSRTINVIDFGAARSYNKPFVDGYMRLVWAAANRDRDTILQVSKDLHFLTGDETAEMMTAHVDAGLIVGEPFLTSGPFDFSNSKLTSRIGQYGETFMKYRLTPPPTEAYSLHRKLAGAFLLCIKLRANIPCRDILEDTFKNYNFEASD
jgi:aarF domain-containing kinase